MNFRLKTWIFLQKKDNYEPYFEIFLPHFSKPIQIFPILADSFEKGIANPRFEAVGLQIRRNNKE